MGYEIKLNPELNVSLADIALAWNDDLACRQVAELQYISKRDDDPNAGISFTPELQQMGMLLLAFGGGALADAMADVIKEKLKEAVLAAWERGRTALSPSEPPPPPPTVKVQTIRQPDGAILFVVE